MTNALRLGVVGLGAVFQLVYEPILTRRRDLFDVVAVVELSAALREVIGRRLGVPDDRRYGRVGELVAAGGLDAVVVLSSGSHAAVVDELTAEGLPVLVEKPLAWTHAELHRLVPRAELVQVGYMKRFDPAYRRLRSLLDPAGASVRAVEVTVLHPSDARQVSFRRGGLAGASDVPGPTREAMASRAAALRSDALGEAAAATLGWVYSEVLLGSVIHDLSILRPLVGDPLAVSSALLWPDGWHPDRLSVAFDADLAGGAQLSLRWHYLADYPEYRETVAIHTETGTYALDFPTPYLLHAPTGLTVTTAAGSQVETSHTRSHVEAFEAQLEDFHSAVTNARPPCIGLDEARADVTTCQRVAAALASAVGLPIGGEAACPRAEAGGVGISLPRG